jgi:signal transduction histidine kinase
MRQRWRSIEWNLPLLISALLLAVVVTVAAIAYSQMRHVAITAAEQRVQSVSQRLSTLLTQSLRGSRLGARQAAANTAVQDFLAHRDSAGESAARNFLAALRAKSPQFMGAELRDAKGQPALLVGTTIPPLAVTPDARTVAPAVREAWISPLTLYGDSLYSTITAPVVRSSTDTLGYLVEYLRISLAGGEAIRGLIGADALFLLGNRDGSLWTDLEHIVPGPRRRPERESLFTREQVDGERQLGAFSDMPTAPWTVWVALPEHVIVAPVHAFLDRLVVLGLLTLVLGAAAGWLVSRRITKPLHEVVCAAEGITTGDYSRRVGPQSGDELGRLATAFNSMAAQVEESRHELEERVAERTRELSAALSRLSAAQEELVRKEKLALLGQLAGGVGHELRNPLGVMTNAVHYLGLVLTDAPATVGEYLGILRAQIGLAERIVGDLLDSARVKPPQREPVAIGRLITDQFERIGTPDGITVEFDVPASLPHLCVDRVQIGQVLLNLITNAVQAMTNRTGTLILRARADGDAALRLDIRDTGVGIPPEQLDKIFEPLFTTKARGLGLGLSVARALVHANGGELTVTSEVGAGSTFTLLLPTLPGGPA